MRPHIVKTCLLGFCMSAPSIAAIGVNDGSFSYAQNFSSLVAAGGSSPVTSPWANDSTIAGWSLFTSSLSAPTTYRSEIGNQDIGSFTAYGNGGSSDRALGAVGLAGAYFGSPTVDATAGHIALSFMNSSGVSLDSFTVNFNGEQWRYVGSAAQTMVMTYGFGATFASVATWTSPGAQFNWTSPLFGGLGLGGIDGNGVGQVSGLGGAVPVSWLSNQNLWLRWTYTNTGSGGQGMGIDDVSFSVTAIPEPSSTLLLLAGLATIALFVGARRRLN